MSYIIGSPCVSTCDTACVVVCPVDCIHGPIDIDGRGKEVEGMSKEEVIKIMGMPVASVFDRGVEEFHYCSTGMYVDNFVSFFFKDGKVVSKTTYNVNAADAGYSSGHCKLFVKRGNYRVPDKVLELRATIY